MPNESREFKQTKREKELENQIFEQKIRGIKAQVVSLGDTLHQRITALESQNTIEFSYLKESLHAIKDITNRTLTQTTLTNSRVTKIEKLNSEEKFVDLYKNTRIIRFMHKYPKITLIFIIVGYLFTIKEIRDHIFLYTEDVLKLFGIL